MKRTETEAKTYALRNHRIASGRTAKDVAARMGATPPYVSRLERHNVNPTAASLAKYFDAVGRTDLSMVFRSTGQPDLKLSLRRMRKAAGLTVSETAARMGDHASSVSKMEVDAWANPRAAILGRFFAAVGRDDLAALCKAVTDVAGVLSIEHVQSAEGRRVTHTDPGPLAGGVVPPLGGVDCPVLDVAVEETPQAAVRRFLADETTPATGGGGTPPRKLYTAFKVWCEATGTAPMRERAFLGCVYADDTVPVVSVPATGQRAFGVAVRRSM